METIKMMYKIFNDMGKMIQIYCKRKIGLLNQSKDDDKTSYIHKKENTQQIIQLLRLFKEKSNNMR